MVSHTCPHYCPWIYIYIIEMAGIHHWHQKFHIIVVMLLCPTNPKYIPTIVGSNTIYISILYIYRYLHNHPEVDRIPFVQSYFHFSHVFFNISIYIIFYLVHDDYMELIDLTINSARYDGFLGVYGVYTYIYIFLPLQDCNFGRHAPAPWPSFQWDIPFFFLGTGAGLAVPFRSGRADLGPFRSVLPRSMWCGSRPVKMSPAFRDSLEMQIGGVVGQCMR